MNRAELQAELTELASAEEFLDYFGLDYDPAVVHVNRLHILQRFHDYLEDPESEDCSDAVDYYRQLLARAYSDFVDSDARSQKVFRVFRAAEPQVVTLSPDQIGRTS
jgi:nitrogenase-stabilizing/protective protein